MTARFSVASTPVVSSATASVFDPLAPGSDERWAAWQARSAAHDRAEHTLAIVAPIIALVAAAILYAFVVR